MNSLQCEIPEQIESPAPLWLQQQMRKIQNIVAQDASRLLSQDLTIKKQEYKCSEVPNICQNQEQIKDKLISVRIEEQKLKEELKKCYKAKKELHQPKYQISKPLTNRQLKKLTQKYRQFKSDIKMKSQLIKLSEQQYKENCQTRKKHIIEAEREKNRVKAIQNLKKLELQKTKPRQTRESELKCQERLKKKKLYQKMIENYQCYANQAEQSKYNHYSRVKENMSISFDSLKAHEQNYQNLLLQKQQKRNQSLKESRLCLPEISPYKSKFYHDVIEKQREREQEENAKKNHAKSLNRIHRQFEDKVLRNYLPTVLRPLDENHEKITKARYAVSKEDFKKMGNKYYSQGQSRIRKDQISPSTKKQLQTNVPQLISKKYPDYLPQVLKQHNVQIAKKNRQNRSKNKIKEILSNKQSDPKSRLQLLQSQIHQLYPTDQYMEHDQDSMIKKLKTKLQILSMMDSI